MSDVYTNKNGQFLINAAGLELVKSFEGLFLHSYQDSVGVWTLGYGRILHDDGTKVTNGQICSQEQADQWLLEDLEKDGGQFVRKMFGDSLNPNQFSSLTSFTFNRGAGRLRAAYKDAKGIVESMPHAILSFNWALNHGEHEYLLGLDRRRHAERELFLGHDWTAFDSVAKFKAWKRRGDE